jgi:hypothetical protein
MFGFFRRLEIHSRKNDGARPLKIQHDGIIHLFEEGTVLIAVTEVRQKAWLLILSFKIICGLFNIAIISSDCVVWNGSRSIIWVVGNDMEGSCCYIRTNSTKSLASGAGNFSEPRLMSQVGRLCSVVCA